MIKVQINFYSYSSDEQIYYSIVVDCFSS